MMLPQGGNRDGADYCPFREHRLEENSYLYIFKWYADRPKSPDV